tara:strand:- start:669 stop:1301 length:633 start_codon:yes stop_codon:yes gene_type:complete
MGIKQFNFSNFFDNLIHASIHRPDSSLVLENNFAIPIQTHSNNIKVVKRIGVYDNVDGLISSKEYNIPLSIKVADCMPIYIYDRVTNYYGLIHSGWRGTKNKIISKALDYFISEFNSFYSDIFIVIGPHIQKCCYEVDWDVAQYFPYSIKNNEKSKWFLNLNKEIKSDILKFNIPIENIYSSDICTYESLLCESFRRDGINSNRMIGVIK